MGTILLNDLLRLPDLASVKVRFNKYAGRGENGRRPDFIEYFQEDKAKLMEGHFHNYSKKAYREGDIVIGFAEVEKAKWLLFDVSRVTRDLGVLNGMGYEYETLGEYEKYFGRVVVRYHNTSQNLIRKARSLMDQLEVETVLSDVFADEGFPGYENVRLSWRDLARNIGKESWKTALQNQKGVYLITDAQTGRLYVGSAYGDMMLLGRWQNYVQTGHGGNVELRKLDFEYIKGNFWYSILEIYKASIDDDVIIKRESWWKDTLQSRGAFGYNGN